MTGTLTGTGNLVKTGAGTLRLGNVGNAYGNTLVEAGTLIGNAASISGIIGNAATVVFDQAGDARFGGDIVGLNGTVGAMIKRGAGNLTLAGISSLDWSIEAGGLASSAERFGGNAAIGPGASLTFDQSANAAYAGAISGAGSFIKTGAGALVHDGDSSSFAGMTRIDAGTLIVGSDTAHAGAALGGSMNVGNGGTLAGHGAVGSGAGSLVTIASGGTLAPGNSIGTLTVNGDLVFAAGSRYAIEVDPDGTASDRVQVTGNAILNGGSVAHVGANGNYRLRSAYTILSAGGTLSGRFDGVTSDYAFLTPTLSYDYAGRTVDLTLTRNNIDFASSGATGNQIATANAIDGIGMDAGNPLYDAIALLPNDVDLARRSFGLLSGEIRASAKTALAEDSRFIRDAATDRIRAAFGDVGASFMPVMAYGETGPVPAAPTTDRFAVWGQGFGAWGRTDSDGNAAKLKTSTGGFLMGADAPVFDTWRLGIMAGYSRTSFDVKDRNASGSSDNYHLGLYGGARWGNLGLRSGLAYTWHDISTSRSVAFPGFADSLKGNYDAGTFQAFGELGYRIDTSVAAFEPFANLAYVSLRSDGFGEQGGAAALTSAAQTTNTTFTTLGLRASAGFTLGTFDATARGMIGWRHAFGDTVPLSTLAFAGSDAFTVAGVPIARNAAIVEAGLDLAIAATTTLGLSYSGQLASDAQQHSFKANLKFRF